MRETTSCKISKIIIYKANKNKLQIDKQKLQRLAILTQIKHIQEYKQIIFPDTIMINHEGIYLKLLNLFFRNYNFNKSSIELKYYDIPENIEQIIDNILIEYGNKTISEIDNLEIVKELYNISEESKNYRFVSADMLLKNFK